MRGRYHADSHSAGGLLDALVRVLGDLGCVVVTEPVELLALVSASGAGGPRLGLLGEAPVTVLAAHVPRSGVFRLPPVESHGAKGTTTAATSWQAVTV